MLNTQAKQQLRIFLQITEEKLEELLSICTLKHHKKGEILHSRNSEFTRLGYIIEGAARIFYITDEGEEINYLLQVTGDVIGDYVSYLTGQISTSRIEILVDSEVLYFEKSEMEKLIAKDVFWLKFSKMMSDMAFLNAKNRIDELFFFTPEQRYLNLLKKSSHIFQLISQKHISSYLGVTPQSLSRIRKRLTPGN